MDPKVAILGLACLGTVAGVRRDALRLLALGMAAVWCEANMLYAINALDWLPIIELPTAIAAIVAWKVRAVSVVFPACWLARLMLHVSAGMLPFGVYAHTLNALYLAGLAALAWEGGVGNAIGSCLRDLCGGRLALARPSRRGNTRVLPLEVDRAGG